MTKKVLFLATPCREVSNAKLGINSCVSTNYVLSSVPAAPEVCLDWFFMITISLAKMLAAPRANIAKTISIGPKRKTTAAPIVQPTKGHSTISRSLLFLVPGSNSNIATPDVKPVAVTIGADSQQRAFANKGPDLSTGMATAIQPT